MLVLVLVVAVVVGMAVLAKGWISICQVFRCGTVVELAVKKVGNAVE